MVARLPAAWGAIVLLAAGSVAADPPDPEPARTEENEASSAETPALPDEASMRIVREARILVRLGNESRAKELLWEAARDHAEDVAPLLALATLDFQGKLSREEATKRRSLLAQRLGDPACLLPYGPLAEIVENGETPRSELRILRTAIETRAGRTSPDTRLLDLLALLQEIDGEPEAARETLVRVLAVKPTDDLRWRCVTLDQRLGRWEDALMILRQLERPADTSVRVRVALIEALAKTGRHEELMQLLQPLLREPLMNNMMKKSVLLTAAWALRDAGMDAQAEKTFRLVLEIDADDEEAKAALLHLYARGEERSAHARAVDERWRKEEDPDALLQEGSARLAAGDAHSAIALLERAAARLPESEIAWFNFGLAAYKLEKWDAAEMALRRAVRLNPDRLEASFNLGGALFRLGRCEEAITVFEQVLKTDPNMHDAHYYLYGCYKKMGDEERARKELTLYNAGN